jgi:hypothetical protein
LSTKTTSSEAETPAVVFKPVSPPAVRVPDSFPGEVNLDPALLDPEMSNYFFGPTSYEPLPISEIEPQVDEYSRDQILLDPPGPSWMTHYDSFDPFIAEPLSDSIPPTDLLQQHSTMFRTSTPSAIAEERLISISPSMLDKSASVAVTTDVVWYSNGVEMQVGGKKPPRTKDCEKEKGYSTVLGERRKTQDSEDVVEMRNPQNTEIDTKKRKVQEMQDTIKVIKREVTTRVQPKFGKPVETASDSTKRIKLVLDKDLSSTADQPRPSISLPGTKENPVKLDDIAPIRIPCRKEEDILPLPKLRISPPPIYRPRPLPTARELCLDENTPPPTPHTVSTHCTVEIIVPDSTIDKRQYPYF